MRAPQRIGTILLGLGTSAGCAGPSIATRVAAAESAMERRREARAAIAELESRLAVSRERVESAWTPPEERRRVLEDERRLVELRGRSEEERLAALEALHRAEEAAPGDPSVRGAAARFWFEEWREAMDRGEEVSAPLHEARVRARDPEGTYATLLEGRGEIALGVAPDGAEVFLFRHEEATRFDAEADPVLVPIPAHPDRALGLDARAEARAAGAGPPAATPTNRLGATPLAPFSALPGSYLVLVRREGFEDLRLPILLERGGSCRVQAQMLRAGTTPEGFVFVPGGTFRAGGDPLALRGWTGSVREVPSFWISRDETTVREYLEFLNDPSTLREVEEERGRSGELVRVPRDATRPEGYWARGPDGRYATQWPPDAPVAGVSWEDAKAYARWRTGRASAQRFVFDLPREEEWEKAARGVDGRKHPWGDAFDWGLCRGGLSSPEGSRPEPVGRFPRDESIYGVRDLAGGVCEWCEEWMAEGVTRVLRGGSFELRSPLFFRCAYRSGSYPRILLVQPGIRLVARRRGDEP